MDDIGASNGGDWEAMKLLQAKLLPKGLDLLFQLPVGLLVIVKQVELVDHDCHVLESEQAHNRQVATCLGEHALTGINQ